MTNLKNLDRKTFQGAQTKSKLFQEQDSKLSHILRWLVAPLSPGPEKGDKP